MSRHSGILGSKSLERIIPPEYCHSIMGDGVCEKAARGKNAQISKAAQARRWTINGTIYRRWLSLLSVWIDHNRTLYCKVERLLLCGIGLTFGKSAQSYRRICAPRRRPVGNSPGVLYSSVRHSAMHLGEKNRRGAKK
jgi:hypothetical protein